ncbi:MAG: transcription antitermination factor NusB [Pirellulaceae bacterium]|nr:transcription antitermination factor NusB [Pirellulaceae bacterium]
MARRTRAREVVLQILYTLDLNPDTSEQSIADFLAARLDQDLQLVDFGMSIISGVQEQREMLDQTLRELADNWSLERMAATDRNILRMGVFEIRYSQTPPRVVINEAVELAKRFGAKQSPQFVNGILDRVLNADKT